MISRETSVALATESSGYVCSRTPCGLDPFSTFYKNAHIEIFPQTERPTDRLIYTVQDSFNKSNNSCLQILLEIQLNAHFDIFPQTDI